MDLRDRTVVITGASMGIGEALARAYAAEGAKLVLAARSEERLQKVAASLPGGSAITVRADVTDPRQRLDLLDRATQKFGKIDILVNNAGVGMYANVGDMDQDEFHKLFLLNVYAPVFLIQAALPLMKYRREGQIINISSVAGHISLPGMGAYCASKFALRAFTDSLRAEVKPFGIHVMGVYPGRIRTPFSENAYKSPEVPIRFNTTHRGISAEKCAQAVVKASKENRREVVTPWSMKPAIHFAHWFPERTDSIIARRMVRKKAAD